MCAGKEAHADGHAVNMLVAWMKKMGFNHLLMSRFTDRLKKDRGDEGLDSKFVLPGVAFNARLHKHAVVE